MGEIELTDHDLPGREELVRLYSSVGWATYTRDPAQLHIAIRRSLRVVCARDEGVLVGLARAVGDGVSIIYVADILVAPSHQGRGMGRRLMNRLLAPYEEVRQKVLITDDEPRQRGFYEAMGFREIADLETPVRAFIQFS